MGESWPWGDKLLHFLRTPKKQRWKRCVVGGCGKRLCCPVWLCQKVSLTWKRVINRNLTTGSHTSISAMKILISEKENRTESGFHVSGGSLLLRPFPFNHLSTILEPLRPVALVLLRRMAVCRWSPRVTTRVRTAHCTLPRAARPSGAAWLVPTLPGPQGALTRHVHVRQRL